MSFLFVNLIIGLKYDYTTYILGRPGVSGLELRLHLNYLNFHTPVDKARHRIPLLSKQCF